MRRGLRGRRLGFALLAAISIVMLMYTGDALWLWVLLLQMFTLMLGAAQVAATLLLARITSAALPAVTTSGGTVKLTINIQNHTAAPFGHMAISYNTAMTKFDGVVRTYYAALGPFGRVVKTEDIELPYRGEYMLGAVRLAVVDFFGLVRFERKLPAAVLAAAYPKVGEALRPCAGSEKDGSTLSQTLATATLSQISDIRDFREGDPTKHIHWKLSQRFGKLLVREFGGAEEAQSAVLMDCSSHGLAGVEAAAYEDALCSAAATVLDGFAGEERQICLITYGEARGTLSGAAADYLPYLARLRFGGTIDAAEAVRLEATSHKSMIVITRQPTAELCERLCAAAAGDTQLTLICVVRGRATSALSAAADELRRTGIDVYVTEVEI